MHPRFSIIIPVYNVAKFLEQCIESVLSQTFKSYEIILVDDGSSDKSPIICDKYDAEYDNITVIHKKNGGLSDARNVGLDAAKGEYVIFLDSDDYYLTDDFFTEINDCIIKDKSEAVFFKRRYYYEEIDKLSDSPMPYPDIPEFASAEDILYELATRDMLDASACMKAISREYLIMNNLYFKKGIFSEDVEWFFRLSFSLTRISLLNKPAYCYRKRAGSITASITERNILDLYNTIESTSELLKNLDCQPRRKSALLNYLAYQYYIVLGLSYIYLNNNTKNSLFRKYKSYRWLTRYNLSKKTKLCSLCVKLIGIKFSSIILGGYIVNK